MHHHLLVWQNGKLDTNFSLEGLQEVLADPHTVAWLDIEDDSGKYADTLAHIFKLSHLTIDTITEEAERSKLIEGLDYFNLVVHGLVFDSTIEEADTPKLDIVFGKNFLVTAHRATLGWLDTLLKSMSRGEDDEKMLSRGVPFLLYTILDTLTDSYFPVLDTLDDLIDDLENATVNTASDDVQKRIFHLKRALVQMRRVISPQIEVLNALITRTGDLIPTNAEPYFSQVHDHLVRAFEVLDSYRDLMSGLLDVYLSTVSNRLNRVMKQLTIIATVFMPITFITGVFGQNFGHSPQVEYDAGYNFWIVLAFMALLSIGQVWYFRRRGWF